MSKRIRDYGIEIGELPAGKKNMISDVDGVKVGHVTLNESSIKTGVTAVMPHQGNPFKEKCVSAVHVMNGFGKTIGTLQIEELGTLETPIILTNTLSVGTACDALIDYMLEKNEEIGDTTGTVNPIVCECNDSYLNDIRGRHVKQSHVREALETASETVAEGAVGAGTGMSCFGFKGGIGTASRVVRLDQRDYTLGVLVLTNYGRQKDFLLNGEKWVDRMGERIANDEPDKGSIIVILATDVPLTEHQLKRVLKRTAVGIERTGSYIGNGSGEVAVGFSTAVKIPHETQGMFTDMKRIQEDHIDFLFRAAAESTEEAILNSLVAAETTVGRNGNKRVSLKNYMEE